MLCETDDGVLTHCVSSELKPMFYNNIGNKK